MLSLSLKAGIRRHLGFPVIGLSRTSPNPSGGTLASAAAGYRYHQSYGFLEYKMNNLNPDEEARLTGQGYAGVALTGPQPNYNDTLVAVLSGGNIASPQTITVTAGVPVPNYDGRLTLLLQLSQAIATNAVLQTAQIYSFAPYGTGPYALTEVPMPECGIAGSTSFSISVSGTGQVSPQLTATGAQLPPVTSLDGGTTQIYGYLPILDGLEGAFYSTSDNLDTTAAAVWKARRTEIAERMSLYKNTVGMLSDFIGIPVNPYRKSRPSRTGSIRYL
jgi:hypothetical protein